jgi:hypothetical protein
VLRLILFQKKLWINAEAHLRDLKAILNMGSTSANSKALLDIQLHAYILEVEILGRLGRFDDVQKAIEASFSKHFRIGSDSVTAQSIQPETVPIQVCEAVVDLLVRGASRQEIV